MIPEGSHGSLGDSPGKGVQSRSQAWSEQELDPATKTSLVHYAKKHTKGVYLS